MKCTLLSLLFCSISLVAATTPSVNVLYSFPPNGLNGGGPEGNLILDSQGNLYGTTFGGGANKLGTVFELSPNGSGGFNYSVLYSFKGSPDGANPVGNLIFDSAGNLYGVTSSGGTPSNFGMVFELSPIGNGQWSEKSIHNFQGANDGIYPQGLAIDSSGNIYGTTREMDNEPKGDVFELSQNQGVWTFTVLFLFQSPISQGANPHAGLAIDSLGNLYGTTFYGGSVNAGALFQLQPPSQPGGNWTENILSNFGTGSNHWCNPASTPVLDSQGNIYGTLLQGGNLHTCNIGGPPPCSNNLCGAVFELSPNGSGGYNRSILHQFNLNLNPEDGSLPQTGVVLDSLGNLYGTTQLGGLHGKGTVYRLTQIKNGIWDEANYSFCTSTGACPTGAEPIGGVVLDPSGNVYLAPFSGGDGIGTVLEIIP